MSEIQKNSREYFVKQALQTQKDALKNLKDSYDNRDLDCGTFEDGLFVGTREQIHERYKDLEQDPTLRGFLQPLYIEKAGGVDNLFDILDADGNGEVTQEEVDDAAAMDSYSWSDKVDTTFSVKDLKVIYENAMAADGATYENNDNTEKISYKNGDVTEIEYNDDGKIISRADETITRNNQTFRVEQNYETSTKTEELRDSKGRVVFHDVDAPGILNDVRASVSYNSDGTKVIMKDTVGKTVITKFDENGEEKENLIQVKYNSNSQIESTEQHSVGECWLLAGVNALASTEKGRQILAQAIQHNDDGSVTVHLKGVGQSYTYSAEEIVTYQYTDNTKRLSTGDVDMKLLEMAMTDYKLGILPENKTLLQKFPLLRNSQATKDNPLNGGNVDEMMEYLTGENAGMAISVFSGFQVHKKEKDPERYAMTAAFLYSDKGFDGGKIVPNHVYSISRVTKDTVYLVNPWDSSQEIAYPKTRFYTHVAVTSELDLKKVKLEESEQKK